MSEIHRTRRYHQVWEPECIVVMVWISSHIAAADGDRLASTFSRLAEQQEVEVAMKPLAVGEKVGNILSFRLGTGLSGSK